MLDSRHAVAPARRRWSKPTLAGIAAAAALALLAWSLWPGQPPAEQIAPATAGTGHPGVPSPAGQDDAPQVAEYTQSPPAVGKDQAQTDDPGQAPVTALHPPDTGQPATGLEWKTYAVRRGDTLGTIFKRFSIDIGLASRIVENETGANLKHLMPGQTMRLGLNDQGRLRELRYELDRKEELQVRLQGPDEIEVTTRQIPTQTRERTASKTIGKSLFTSATKAGLNDRLIMDLVKIFAWDIDFALDIRAGDRYSIIYEEMVRNGRPVGTGGIIAAEFINDGEVHHAVRHVGDDGGKSYFDLEGNSLRSTFLKTPMRVSRVTSGFSKSRYHPILKEWRAHRGVDYGAPRGTPVLATGDGRVHSMGRNGGYGKVIVLRHGDRYTTLYAHLSDFKQGLARGSAVEQGQVIGYVGATGLATGPHLHYEFRVNGEHRDPMNLDVPRTASIAERHRETFLLKARERIDQIRATRPEQVASRF